MTKKDYILAVLTKVSWLWASADHIKELLLADQLTTEYIDYLYEECVKAVNGALQEQNQEQQNSIVAKLSSVKDAELKQSQADQADIDNLEKLIASM